MLFHEGNLILNNYSKCSINGCPTYQGTQKYDIDEVEVIENRVYCNSCNKICCHHCLVNTTSFITEYNSDKNIFWCKKCYDFNSKMKLIKFI